ncbi:MAG: hypothetical protein HXX19_04800 [Rhodoferax sp.]|nr:hypothetical protein [Rhodoferax sp.]
MLNIKSLIAATVLSGVAALSFAADAPAAPAAAPVAAAPAADAAAKPMKKHAKKHVKKVKAAAAEATK